MKIRTITAVMVPPMEVPCTTTLLREKTFANLAVSIGASCCGDAALLRLNGKTGILYYDGGALYDLKPNRRINDHLICGVFYVVGICGNRLCSLTEAETAYYLDRFHEPEAYTDDDAMHAYFDSFQREIDRMEQSATAG